MIKSPVLFLIFNRPDVTEKVFHKIREAKPSQLYIGADGPRPQKQDEDKLCEITRNIVLKNIDWDCQVYTLFRDKNLGCKEAVSTAITWFFEQVEEGIILEDDTLPDSSFFRFCDELLPYYRNESNVMSVCGSNLLGEWTNGSSYFWAHGGIWGWATWRRAWKMYDKNMSGWGKKNIKVLIKKRLGTAEWYKFYEGMFNEAYSGKMDTWDIQWFYTVLANGGYCINPETNMIQNIGFGQNATHTSSNPYLQELRAQAISFPLSHPTEKKLELNYLKQMYKKINVNPGFISLVLNFISKLKIRRN